MFRPLSGPRLVLLALLLCFTAATIAPAQSVPVSAATNTNQWLVELTGSPTSDGGNAAGLQKDQAAFRKAAAAANITYSERKAFSALFNGLAITATRSAATAIGMLPGVKAVYPDTIITLDPRAGTSQPDLFWAIQMTGADLVQNTLGFTGKGVKVGVIDTGVDYNHPDLGGCFGPGCHVAGGTDLVGDAYNADDANPVIAPDPNPMDCAGHGTHVSGIIGANGAVKGVAPEVTLYMYRVFGCVGSTSDSVMIDAMEHALNDGVQVVNMSIGAAFGWPQWPTAMASDRLVKKGVVVVASFGNSGANGLYSGGAPGLGSQVIGVASFDNLVFPGRYFTADNGDPTHPFIYSGATGSPAAPTSGSLPITKFGTTTTTNDGCSAFPAGSLTGKAVLIRRGTCTFNVKSFNAQNAGAAAVVLYNNTAGALNPTVAGPPNITIPVVAITAADGALLNTRIASGATNITWTDQFAGAPSPTAGLISSFSSYGLSPDLIMKPDIGAPGGNILSTWPLALGGYAVLSGTSMSSPHVAGTAALLLQAFPKTQSRKVRDILQNTARPALWSLAPGYGLLDSTFRQGAGMVNIYDAITATTRITPGKIATGEGQAGPVTTTLTISNNADTDVTYNTSFVSGIAATQGDKYSTNVYTQGFYTTDETVSFSPSTVTVPAGSSVPVDVTITPPTVDPSGNVSAPEDALYGGYLVFTPTADGTTLQVPYGGIVGDYQAIQVLKPTPNGFPWLARVVGTSYVKQLDGAVYTLANGDIPYILMHFEHQFQQLQMQVLDPVSGKNFQYIDNEKYLPSNSTPSGFYPFTFDGTTFTPSGKNSFTVPNGNYVINVRALKALGNPDNPADWETWTSPVFTITR
ncbi:MAG: S8 family serine peptidase [Terriglobales bacterium]